MGLDVYLKDENNNTIESKSTIHPGHLFKVGYFRSSYNSSGIDSVLETIGVPTLYHIFGVKNDSDVQKPNWEKALEEVRKAIKLLKEKKETTEGSHYALQISHYETPAVRSEKDAIRVFKSHYERPDPTFGAYSNTEGFFSPKEPLAVKGVVHGASILKKPAVYLIIENKERLDWYIQALEIVEETIQYVLSQPSPKSYTLYWSA